MPCIWVPPTFEELKVPPSNDVHAVAHSCTHTCSDTLSHAAHTITAAAHSRKDLDRGVRTDTACNTEVIMARHHACYAAKAPTPLGFIGNHGGV